MVPLPQTTPVDANPMARAAYLEAYRDGYRSARMGDNRSIDRVSGPYLFARRLGWQAGVADGARGADPNAPEIRR